MFVNRFGDIIVTNYNYIVTKLSSVNTYNLSHDTNCSYPATPFETISIITITLNSKAKSVNAKLSPEERGWYQDLSVRPEQT